VARGAGAELRRFLGEYQSTWHATGPAGRGFLLGGLVYLVRAVAFSVAFPLFAKAHGYSSGDIGLGLAASQFALFLLGIPVTFLGGRGFARRLLILSPAIAAIGIAVILTASDGSPLLVAFGALLAGAGGASFWVLGDPLLAETTPPGDRARVYALKFFLVTVGVALGGGLGGWIPGALEVGGVGNRAALTATLACLGLLDLAQVSLFFRIPPYESVRRRSRPFHTETHSESRDGRGWWPWAVMILLALPEVGMALGHNSIRPFLSLYFTEDRGLSPSSTGTALAVFGLIAGLGALAAPRVALRFGNIAAVALLRSIPAATILLWFTGIGLPPLLLLMLFYYLALDGTEAIFIAEAMSRVPSSRRTWFSGIYGMAWSISASLASLLSGEIQDLNDGRFGAAFAVGVGGYLFSALWLTLAYPKIPALAADPAPAEAQHAATVPVP
jgi:MFS family permease